MGYRQLFMGFIALMLFIFPPMAYGENIDPDNDGSQYAWGENIGWLNLEPGGNGGSGVEVGNVGLIGYMWGENIGWIKLNLANGGVVNDGNGNLSGYAWGENVGWINFNPTGGGVTINPATGVLSGYAWGENIGWINFSPAGGYGAKTSWRADFDNDGYTADVDCNDNDPAVNPGATEGPYGNATCTDGKDNDCDGAIDAGDSGCQQSNVDLIVSALTGPTTGKPGSTITITDTTKNNGPGSAPASTTKIYWSTNTTWDAGDTYLGSRAIPALAALATNKGTITVSVPAGACSGTFYIIAKADADNLIAETNENNNTKSKSIKTGPDLIVSAVTAPLTSGAGKTISVSDTTKNNGGCPAGASTTKLYFSINSAWDAGDTYLGERAVPGLAAGATNTGSTSVTIPAGATTGTRYIIAKADANAVVAETSETNNKKSKSIKIGPDLIVSTLTAPTSAVRGSTISVTDTTKNSGGGDAGASTTKLYLSTNTTWDAGDTYLGSRSVPMLTAGASSAGSTSVTIPSGIATGPYYIIALADDGKVVTESNETNNKKTKAITIK